MAKPTPLNYKSIILDILSLSRKITASEHLHISYYRKVCLDFTVRKNEDEVRVSDVGDAGKVSMCISGDSGVR